MAYAPETRYRGDPSNDAVQSPTTLILNYLQTKGIKPTNASVSQVLRDVERDPSLIPGLRAEAPTEETSTPQRGGDSSGARGNVSVGQRGSAARAVEGGDAAGVVYGDDTFDTGAPASGNEKKTSAPPKPQPQPTQKQPEQPQDQDALSRAISTAVQQDPASGGVSSGGINSPQDALAAMSLSGLDPATLALLGAGGGGAAAAILARGGGGPTVGGNFGPAAAGASAGRPVPGSVPTVSTGPYTVSTGPMGPPPPPFGPPTAGQVAAAGIPPVDPALAAKPPGGPVGPGMTPPEVVPQMPSMAKAPQPGLAGIMQSPAARALLQALARGRVRAP